MQTHHFHQNLSLLLRLLVVTAVMFAFGYALVPFYQKLCAVTGLNILTERESVTLQNTQVDTSRTIKIIFDANARGPFQFHPVVNSLEVHPGQIAQVMYQVNNTQGHAVVAQAIPSYAPREVAQYFSKLECFCFTQQTLAAFQKQDMPVVFVIDPALPKNIETITLSYTFFEIAQPVLAKKESI